MKRNDPTGIGDIIKKMVATTRLGEDLEKAKIWEHWAEVAGTYLSQHGEPSTLKDGVLTVDVESPVWMHKYAYRKWDIIRRANRLVNRALVSDLFIRLASDEPDEEDANES